MKERARVTKVLLTVTGFKDPFRGDPWLPSASIRLLRTARADSGFRAGCFVAPPGGHTAMEHVDPRVS
jgi:hypothetical protein